MPLVELAGRVARLDAEAEPLVAGGARLRDQLLEQLVADAVPALGGDDGDRELGRPLVDEPVARLVEPKTRNQAAPTGKPFSSAITAVSPGLPHPRT